MMKKNTRLIIILTGIILLPYCHDPFEHRYNQGTFPDIPVNMGNINSMYDDYNSTSPILGGTAPLCFSSNRGSNGGNFDIVYKLLDVIMTRSDGKISVEENTNGNMDIATVNSNLNTAVSIINTSSDELGPYLIPKSVRVEKIGNGYYGYQNYILLYASNESGNLDIKFTQNVTGESYTAPQNIAFLNSAADEAYPTLTEDSAYIYFCSNRSGNFDIFKADLNKQGDLLTLLGDPTPRTITKDADLSSDYDDKCPYILGNLLVFASNRPGGYGGFDLYYAVFKDGKWSSPVNFGNKINTPYDEYRPIVKTYGDEFTNNFMIFSSNRPGGKGGFDLYYVGIDKMAE